MKTRNRFTTLLAVGIVLTLFSACLLVARGDDSTGTKPKSVLADLEKAKDHVLPGFKLAYHFAPGEVVRTKVVHLATVETKIKGTAQTTKSRTISTRVWRIKEVDAKGDIMFDNVV